MLVSAVVYLSLLISFCSMEKLGSFSHDSTNPKQFNSVSERASRNARRSHGRCEFGISPTQIAQLKRSQDVEIYHDPIPIPQSFDVRIEWPHCESLKEIKEQNACGSCLAIAATSVMSDRLCILTKGAVKFEFSAEQIITCRKYVDMNSLPGCEGGPDFFVFLYWTNFGIVSGGGYNSSKGCQPYSNTSFNYDNKTKKMEPCRETCTNLNYSISFEKDKHYGDNLKYLYPSEDENLKQMQMEIMIYGPVASYLDVHEDLDFYTDGVYKTKKEKGGDLHTVKILGWGIEDGDPYWLVANSWGTQWGKLGVFFKVLRGSNHCGIEDFIVTGTPSLEPKSRNFSRKFSSSIMVSVSPVVVFITLLLCF